MAHYCEKHNATVKEAVLALGLLSEKEADTLLDPLLMTDPEKMAKALADFKKAKGWKS